MRSTRTLVVAIVGVDGCGKSSAFRGALEILAQHIDVLGIGDEVLAGAPGTPLHERHDLPLGRATTVVGRTAKRTRRAWPYQQLKSLDLIGRSRMRDHVAHHEAPTALLTDGDPLVNTLSWSVARLYRKELLADDERVLDALRYLAGDRRIPLRELPYYLRNAPQLAVVNRLHIARFRFPDLVVHLDIEGAAAMHRIRARGRRLQPHETEAALSGLGAGYERVCRLLETRCGVDVIRVSAEHQSKDQIAGMVADAVLDRVPEPQEASMEDPGSSAIEVVATTMSGSLQDQRKIGRIEPRFRAVTRRPVHVHEAHSHVEARAFAQALVARGGRIIVSAGGAGTFNAVLEGCHLERGVPEDLRLAFLRKGSADLIGKMLRIPDDLPAAVAAISDGIERDRSVSAAILAVEATGLDERMHLRHLIGFGGLGIFGDVPRFTETRAVRFYKGILGTLFGDYGPFFAGLALATMWWFGQRMRGRVPAMTLELDGDLEGPAVWSTVIVVSGDLGPAFPLGRGMSFSSDTFRVVALRDVGLLRGLRQLAAAKSGRILDEPERHACLIRQVRTFVARPQNQTAKRVTTPPVMVNVDGLQMISRGDVRFSLSGSVELIAGPDTGTNAGD